MRLVVDSFSLAVLLGYRLVPAIDPTTRNALENEIVFDAQATLEVQLAEVALAIAERTCGDEPGRLALADAFLAELADPI